MDGPGIAVVGRRFGCRVQVPALRAAGFEVLALVGRDRDKTAHKAGSLGIPNACGSLAEALAVPGVDAVAIATPPDTHFPLALEAVEAGRHVLCEKPFTMDADQAARLVEAADRAGKIGAIGHEFRWSPPQSALGTALASGAIGDVRLATIVDFLKFLRNDALAMPEWFDAPGTGGWLTANGSHTLDQIRTWFGPTASVSATMRSTAEGDRDVEDAYSVHLRMASGVEVVLQQLAAAWVDRSLLVVNGTGGTVGIDDGKAWIADRDGTRPLAPPPGAAQLDQGIGTDLESLGTFEERHYERLAAAFRAAIEQRPIDSPVPLPTFADGLAVMCCIDAIRASAAKGGELLTIEGG